MTTICFRCRAVIEVIDELPQLAGTSHGLCEACRERWLADARVAAPLEERLSPLHPRPRF